MKYSIKSEKVRNYEFEPFTVELTFESPIEALDFYVRTSICPNRLAEMIVLSEKAKKKKTKKTIELSPPANKRNPEMENTIIREDILSFKRNILNRFYLKYFLLLENEMSSSEENIEEEMADVEIAFEQIKDRIVAGLIGANLDDYRLMVNQVKTK